MAIGLSYNFYQYKNWNFRVGLQLQWFGNEQQVYIAEEETVLPFDYTIEERVDHERLAYLPLTVEYVFLKSRSFYFALGVGLSYYVHDGTTITTAIDDVLIFMAVYENSENPFYGSAHLEGSIYFKRKSFMLHN